MTPDDADGVREGGARLQSAASRCTTSRRRSRYKKLIVSGTQTAARLMALTATHFSKRFDVVGLDFSVRFHKAVFADETVTLEWEVVAVTPTPSRKGDVVEMKGRVTNEKGELAVAATGRVLVSDKT